MKNFTNEKEALNLEMRSILEKARKGEIETADATAKVQELRARKEEIEKQESFANVPLAENASTNWDEVRSAIMEKRAITLGSNGDSAFSSKVFEVAANTVDILNGITIENGAKPNTKFSLFSPSVNNIKRVAEDGTGSVVSTAAFAPVSVTPAPYMGYVNVSDYFLKFAPNGMEKLAGLFGKGFANQMAKEVISGVGTTELTGIFVDAGITQTVDCAVAGVPKLKDLLKLTSLMTGKARRRELAIVINPIFWADIMAEDTKHTFVNNGSDFFTFNGIRIIESDDAPSTYVAGDKVAVIGKLSDYGIAVASDVELESLSKTAGSLNTPVQGTMYFDGKVIVPSSFATLKAV